MGDLLAHRRQHAIQGLRLRQRAREAVQDPSGAELALTQGVLDQVDDQLIGDELALVHVLLGLLAERGPVLAGLPEDVAGRDLLSAVALEQTLRLRALSGARGSDEDDPVAAHAIDRRPRIRVPVAPVMPS